MDEQKKPRAWVYARIPGDYDGTMNSFKVCSMQALRDGCDIVTAAPMNTAAGCCAPATAK